MARGIDIFLDACAEKQKHKRHNLDNFTIAFCFICRYNGLDSLTY